MVGGMGMVSVMGVGVGVGVDGGEEFGGRAVLDF